MFAIALINRIDDVSSQVLIKKCFELFWWNVIQYLLGTAFPTKLHVHPAKTLVRWMRRLIRVFAGRSVGSQESKTSSG